MNKVEKQSFSESSKEFNLKEQFSIIKKRIWILVIITIITTSFGIIKSKFLTTPIYQSSTRLIISTDPTYMNTLLVLIKDPSILGKVASEFGSDISADSLAQKINVSSINNSQVVIISVSDTDPRRAANIANTTAQVYKNELPNIVNFKDVRLLTQANVNPYPINSDNNRTIILYFVIGLAVGIGMIYFLNLLDDSIGSYDDIEEIAGLPVLGTIPKMNKTNMMSSKKNKEVAIRGENIGT